MIVGNASPDYIEPHKNLAGYTVAHYEKLCAVLSYYSNIVVLPHVVAEVASLCRALKPPARRAIQKALRSLVETTPEKYVPSVVGVAHDGYFELGVTDAVILHLCSLTVAGAQPTLITTDEPLSNTALSLGYDAINFRESFMV